MRFFFIIIILIFYTKFLNAYPNPNIKNKEIIDSIYKKGEKVTIVNESFVPFLDFSNLKNQEITKNFRFKLQLFF